ncbi:MAG: ribonuclease HII [Candidatus Azotimanducaceae bacterium]|jgi:ribonuclease HII
MTVCDCPATGKAHGLLCVILQCDFTFQFLEPWGDANSLSIAMASIAAKVSRDREMLRLGETYPDDGFEQHKGYGTATHRAALKTHGATPIHRALFLRKVLP